MIENKNKLMNKGERTKLTKANDKSYSLRTTVPKGVVQHLGLKEGDTILWKLVPSKKGDELDVKIEPKKRSD